MKPLQFTEIFKSDIPIVRSLALEIFPETYQSLLSSSQIEYMLDFMYSEESLNLQFDNGSHFYLLSDGGNNIGYGSISIENENASLHKFYINSSNQGKGIGKIFIDYLENQAKDLGAKQIELYVKRDNPARYFYDKMGYIVVKEVDKEIGNGYFMNDYLMGKKLGS